MELLFLVILLVIAHKVWPDKKDPPHSGNDIFIPFEDRHSNGTNNGGENSDRDPYFPDGEF